MENSLLQSYDDEVKISLLAFQNLNCCFIDFVCVVDYFLEVEDHHNNNVGFHSNNQVTKQYQCIWTKADFKALRTNPRHGFLIIRDA